MKSLRLSERFTKRESESFKRYLTEIAAIPTLTIDEEVSVSARAQAGDQNAKNLLVTKNLRFVVSIAKHYVTSYATLEDLVNEGNVGLIMAANKYNSDTGFKFISYAVYWIRKMILEYLAKNGRPVRLPANKINDLNKLNQYISTLEQKHGRTVDISEVIAEYATKLTDEEITELEALSKLTFESFDTPLGDDSGATTLYEIIENENVDATDHLVTSEDLRNRIAAVLKTLKPLDRGIMIDLFGLDGGIPLTLKEVGEKVGLTRERVRQIRQRSLKKLEGVLIK